MQQISRKYAVLSEALNKWGKMWKCSFYETKFPIYVPTSPRIFAEIAVFQFKKAAEQNSHPDHANRH